MGKQLAGAGDHRGSTEQPGGRRGVVRFLHNEAAPAASRMVLGNALRHLREDCNLLQQDVATRLGRSTSKISRIETGTFNSKDGELEEFFAIYDVSDPASQYELRELASVANQPAWWQRWSPVAQRYLQAVVSFEDMAQRIRSYEALYLHGLLLAPAYGQAVIKRGRGGPHVHDDLWELRKERQARFNAAENKSLVCVVDEATLLRPVGSSPTTMRQQIEHLLELMDDPRYQLRLAELGNYRVNVELGSTTVFDFAQQILPTIAYAEAFDGGLIIQDEMMVDRRVKEFDALRAASLAPPATRRKLHDLLRTHYR
ncbi:helix-turn-helix domain-containing protein [Streptomyces sp. NPDC058961]|uniref:helix-turn-helix domain-containing protein n=1 Tax=Streptomyces sp. NPDC058961 TaxID=3346680 RepID=UPI0036D18396